MRTPDVTDPREVPALREYLARQWDQPYFAYPQTQVVRGPDGTFHNEPCLSTGVWEREILRHPSYYWVSADMCDLLAHAEKSLPLDTVLEPELAPRLTGLVVFEKSMIGIESNPHLGLDNVTVDALLWGPVDIPMHDRDPGEGWRPALGIGSLRRLTLGTIRDEELAVLGEIDADMWMPLGRCDWIFGVTIADETYPNVDPVAQQSMIEDRQRLSSLWLLMAQEGITETREVRLPRGEHRRETRAGRPSPIINVIDVKRRRAEVDESTGAHERHGKLKWRVPVSGFWRSQPYGPGRAYRRPTYIDPYWRGPKDAPVRVSETVRVWKRQ